MIQGERDVCVCVCVLERERERERRQSKQVLAHAWIELPKKNMAERRTFHFTHFLYQIINHHAESGKEKNSKFFEEKDHEYVFFINQLFFFNSETIHISGKFYITFVSVSVFEMTKTDFSCPSRLSP